MNIKKGDWVKTLLSFESMTLPKGTHCYVTSTGIGVVSIRPVFNPDGKKVNPNIRTLDKDYVDLMPNELMDDEREFLLDWALLDKDEHTFRYLMNRRD